MRVADLLAIKDSKISNREKANTIASLLKARSKRHNPTDTEIPTGWNASPFPGSQTDHTR